MDVLQKSYLEEFKKLAGNTRDGVLFWLKCWLITEILLKMAPPRVCSGRFAKFFGTVVFQTTLQRLFLECFLLLGAFKDYKWILLAGFWLLGNCIGIRSTTKLIFFVQWVRSVKSFHILNNNDNFPENCYKTSFLILIKGNYLVGWDE